MDMIIILEIVRIVLAAAVGYIVANKMSTTSIETKDNTEEKKKKTEEEVNNIPAMISFSNPSEASNTVDKRPLLLKSSMQSDDISEDHHVDIDESDRCYSVMSVDPPGQLVRQRSKRMNELSEIETPSWAESIWNKKQQNVLQEEHDETTSLYDIDSDSNSVSMILQEEDTHNRLQRIQRHQTSINTGKIQRRRMSSISWEDTDDEEDEALTKQMPQFLAKYQPSNSSEWQVREDTDKQNVTSKRGSKEKQDDIRLMLGLHSSSEKSTYTRRNSYYTLARSRNSYHV